MPQQRTIAVVTGSRAEFGLLRSVMEAIREHGRLRLRTVVAGLHLATETWRDVVTGAGDRAGFRIDEKVPIRSGRVHADGMPRGLRASRTSCTLAAWR